MQVITEFIAIMETNEPVFVSHRNNSEHITTGASDYLVQSGIALTRTTSNLSAWVGDTIVVTDFWGKPMYKAKVVAKTIREWDMSKPIGQRLASQKKSTDWDRAFNHYSSFVKKQRGR